VFWILRMARVFAPVLAKQPPSLLDELPGLISLQHVRQRPGIDPVRGKVSSRTVREWILTAGRERS
jgi:hypothetical protein